jgi:hypothetical protein
MAMAWLRISCSFSFQVGSDLVGSLFTSFLRRAVFIFSEVMT